MRHKYETRGIVLARTSLGEASAYITILTPELGLVRARAQSVRRSGAKLSSALATFAESSVVLVRGKDDWRITGAVLEENWFMQMKSAAARAAAARITGLALRLVAGEVHDQRVYSLLTSYFSALSDIAEDQYESAESLAALRILAILGLDAGDIPGEITMFSPDVLEKIADNQTEYAARISHGIEASGL